MVVQLYPYQVTIHHALLRGQTSESETIQAIDPREATYEMLEHHPEIANWSTLEVRVRLVKSLADSASAA